MVHISYNTWWIDSGTTIHVANTMQGFLNQRKPTESECSIYSGNRISSHVEACEALDAFKIYNAEVEKQLGKQIKIVKSDRVGEYYGRYTEKGQLSGPFARFLQEHGIVAQYTMPCSPSQNGVAER
ncbi:hypothetical protein CK203_034004 [Vitis vinifera]|uniref:Integrase catalytic domain-containing protein n=1 Tax=Vitis vinifera TaxID=29760 RepID=A0A438IBM3_VITVI|nr:hypothetical protein CK203_034004 [Vitis vinifera]